MRNYSRIIKQLSLFCLLIFLLSSCEQEKFEHENTSVKIPQKVTEKIRNLGVNPSDLRSMTLNLDGTEQEYWVAKDIMFRKDELFEYQDVSSFDDSETKAYHTDNLVNVPSNKVRTLFVENRISGPNNVVKSIRQGINEYNKLKLDIKFKILKKNSSKTPDIIINVRDLGEFSPGCNVGGMSSFPINGNPGKDIVFTNRIGFTDIEWKHTTMHELGHAIGLRHSDWRTRKSCSSGPCGAVTPELASEGGANFIPGTLRDTKKSNMAACELKAFTQQDKKALRYLY